jgi:hypothetical protein
MRTFFMLLLLSACGSSTEPAAVPVEAVAVPVVEPAEAIPATFNAYRAAILAKDGDAALAQVDTQTITYYGRMLDMARTGSPQTVRALEPADKLLVLMLRQRVPTSQLLDFTPSSFFAFAVDESWISETSVSASRIGRVAVNGTQATGQHIAAGEPAAFDWTFRLQDGAWKLDLGASMPIANKALAQTIAASGQPEETFLLRLIGSISGKAVPPEIWTPPAP